MKNYVYVPGLSEVVEDERKKEPSRTEDDKFITATGAAKKVVATHDNGVVRNKKVDDRSFRIPVWEKYALTIKEAAKYFQIGESNIRRLTREHKDENFIQWKDSHVFIRREEFEKFLDRTNVI